METDQEGTSTTSAAAAGIDRGGDRSLAETGFDLGTLSGGEYVGLVLRLDLGGVALGEVVQQFMSQG